MPTVIRRKSITPSKTNADQLAKHEDSKNLKYDGSDQHHTAQRITDHLVHHIGTSCKHKRSQQGRHGTHNIGAQPVLRRKRLELALDSKAFPNNFSQFMQEVRETAPDLTLHQHRRAEKA